MKPRYKTLIKSLQLIAFFCYIGSFAYLFYRADKEMVYVDIPVKYEKAEVTGWEYGITIKRRKGRHKVRFKSDSFPGMHFETHYYKSILYPQRSFDSIIGSHPVSIGCYLDPDFRETQGKYVPFVYSGQQEKSSVFYQYLLSSVKYDYGYLWLFFLFFIFLMWLFSEQGRRGIPIVVLLLSVAFYLLI